MGYTTDFRGEFTLSKKLTKKQAEYLKRFCATRRMKRDVAKLPPVPKGHVIGEWGTQGEFYCEETDDCGQGDAHGSVVDHNTPATTQPGLWCQWVPSDCGKWIEWDGGEKFYNYVEWINYIQLTILKRWGIKIVASTVEWRGEDWDDQGSIELVKGKLVGRK
jgi:hypothetical protein